MPNRRFIHVRAATHGVLPITTVQSISFTDDAQEIAASGDDDTADSFLAKGKSSVRGELVLQDPTQAAALKAAAPGDLEWKGVPETGGSEITQTLSNVIFFSRRHASTHNGLATETLTFRTYDPTGANTVSQTIAP